MTDIGWTVPARTTSSFLDSLGCSARHSGCRQYPHHHYIADSPSGCPTWSNARDDLSLNEEYNNYSLSATRTLLTRTGIEQLAHPGIVTGGVLSLVFVNRHVRPSHRLASYRLGR